jgi:hypothetical protein
MRISAVLAVVVALVVLVLVVVVGQAIIRPNLPLIARAVSSLERMTPNADGDSDVTEFSYSLSRNATVSIYFETPEGVHFDFRRDEPRIAGDYAVLFSGVVGGFTLPSETINGDVQRRLMPDGSYTWHLVAKDAESGEQSEISGALTIEQGATELPELIDFSVAPQVFTPNQDGIEDRVQVNVYLNKEADLSVYLIGPDGALIYIPELAEGRQPGEPGRHLFDYDGGIDLGVEPPPDGTYTVVAVAQDLEGQRVQKTDTLTLQSGGDPQAEIVSQPNGVDVVFTTRPYDEGYFADSGTAGKAVESPDLPTDLEFSTVTLLVGDLLVFKLTVENYGSVPIRTSGPWPGTVYQQDQVWGAMGIYEESGSWRVGINCSTTTRDFPWRWGVGAPDVLEKQVDAVTGQTFYYLPAGARSVVWGAVRMTDLVEARNPQQCWAGLIHEDVEVSIRNSRVGARDIELVQPTAGQGG